MGSEDGKQERLQKASDEIAMFRLEGLSQWAAREWIEDIEDGVDLVRDRAHLHPDNEVEKAKKFEFIQSALPILQKLRTPADIFFYTPSSPNKSVTGILISKIILFGSLAKNKSFEKSDIDVLVTFPVLLKPVSELSFGEQFDYDRIGYELRKAFKDQWKRGHRDMIPRYKLDIKPFPDSEYANADIFSHKGIWESAVNEGKELWKRE